MHETQEVTGSIPVSSTLLKALKSLGQRSGDETNLLTAIEVSSSTTPTLHWRKAAAEIIRKSLAV